MSDTALRRSTAPGSLLIVAAVLMGLEVLPQLSGTTLVPAILWVALGTMAASAMIKALPRGIATTTVVLFVVQMLVNAGLALSQAPYAADGWALTSFLGNAAAGLVVALLIAAGEAAVRHVVARAIAPLRLLVEPPGGYPVGP